MEKFIPAAKIQDVPPGRGVVSQLEGTSVAIFNVNGKFFATQNHCPHRGGPLGEGELNGTTITCPWHAWQFDVGSGCHLENPDLKLRCFPVKVNGEDILIGMGENK